METIEKTSGLKGFLTLVLAMISSAVAYAQDGVADTDRWYTSWWVWLIVAVVAIWLFSRRRTPRHPL